MDSNKISPRLKKMFRIAAYSPFVIIIGATVLFNFVFYDYIDSSEMFEYFTRIGIIDGINKNKIDYEYLYGIGLPYFAKKFVIHNIYLLSVAMMHMMIFTIVLTYMLLKKENAVYMIKGMSNYVFAFGVFIFIFYLSVLSPTYFRSPDEIYSRKFPLNEISLFYQDVLYIGMLFFYYILLYICVSALKQYFLRVQYRT